MPPRPADWRARGPRAWRCDRKPLLIESSRQGRSMSAATTRLEWGFYAPFRADRHQGPRYPRAHGHHPRTQARQERTAGLGPRSRVHGDVRHVRPGRPRREHRHHPRRARRRDRPARHRRLLRHGPQRAADRRGAPRPPARGLQAERQVRRPARARQRAGSATTPSPPAVKTALAYTLDRLGVDHIDVYRPARLDPKVPIEETVGAIAELVAGRLRAPHRAVRGRRGDDPPRRRDAPDRATCRSSTR